MQNAEIVNVLVVEDDDEDFEILGRRLCGPESGYRLTRARDLDEARATASSGPIDVGLIDYRLAGDINGLDFVRELGGREAPFPMIVLTGLEDADLDREAILSGAYDYVDKMSLTRETMDRAIRFALSTRDYERRLYESIKEAKEQAAVNGRILAVVGHEMQSPLRSIIGYCDYLGEQCGTEATREAAEKMKAAAVHLEDFLRNLSEYVRLDSGAAKLNAQSFDLAEMIRETVDLFRPYAVHKLIRLEARIDAGEDGTIVGDRLRLRQILINLLRNAIEHTDRGSIDVTAIRHEDLIAIEVRDDGTGMSPQKVASVLEDRPRRQAASSEFGGGLGIGLSICRRLLALMNGRLSIESAEGSGTSVTIVVPARRSAASDAA